MMHSRRLRALTLAALFPLAAAALALRAAAQEAPSPDGPPPPSKAKPREELSIDTGQTLKVNVNLVNVYFSVRDKNGYVAGLGRNDCQIAEDKVPQTIKNLTQEKNLPLTIGILLDTSGSQTNVLPLEKDSGARFLHEVVTPKDEAFLISFDVNVDLLADFTNSPRELARALDKASINAASSSAGIPGIGGGPMPTSNPRGTLLYDAVFLAADEKMRAQTGRKVLVLLTDGGDQGSQETLKTAAEAAQKANAIVYVVLISDSDTAGIYGGFYSGAGDMDTLTRETGGRVINVGHNGRKLEDAFNQIQDELRTQYIASYTPLNKNADGKYRKLEMTCGAGMKVQARKGYYAVPSDDSTN